MNHVPVKDTYAIRIDYGTPSFLRTDDFNLNESPHYIHIAEYFFDDIWPGLSSRGFMFDEGLAAMIVSDFDKYRSACESLLVHCSRGRNRSPAVAIALNDIFQLGHDSGALKKQYHEANWHVYNTLMAYAKKSGLVR